MKIYTRTGDKGTTGVMGGRLSKDNIRVDSYGTIDELNAFLGDLITKIKEAQFGDMVNDLTEIQNQLFDAGNDLAQTTVARNYLIKEEMVDGLEGLIDLYESECPLLKSFILPGGTSLSSSLHICRVVTRRAERRVVTLMNETETNQVVGKYLNRLSDLFFVLARVVNRRLGIKDIEYNSNRGE